MFTRNVWRINQNLASNTDGSMNVLKIKAHNRWPYQFILNIRLWHKFCVSVKSRCFFNKKKDIFWEDKPKIFYSKYFSLLATHFSISDNLWMPRQKIPVVWRKTIHWSIFDLLGCFEVLVHKCVTMDENKF